MTPYGMDITCMDAPAGSASASKMFRSIFMKGFVTLLLEMLTAAHHYGVEDDVLRSVKETLTAGPLLEVVNGLVGRGVIHSERREHEMDEVIATLETLKVDGIMSKATKAKLHWVHRARAQGPLQGGAAEGFSRDIRGHRLKTVKARTHESKHDGKTDRRAPGFR